MKKEQIPITRNLARQGESIRIETPANASRPLSALWASARRSHVERQREAVAEAAEKAPKEQSRAADTVRFAWD